MHSTSEVTNKMSVDDEVQMQVTKTVRNVPLSHGHRHEVVNATDDRVVDDALLQTVPHVNQTLFQKAGTSRCSSATVSRALWVDALFC